MGWIVGLVVYFFILVIGILFFRGAAALEDRLYGTSGLDPGLPDPLGPSDLEFPITDSVPGQIGSA